MKSYLRQQEEIERQEELIKRFKNKPSKAAFARSRKKILERMHPVEKPREDMAHIFTGRSLRWYQEVSGSLKQSI